MSSQAVKVKAATTERVQSQSQCTSESSSSAFAPRKADDVFAIADARAHVYGNKQVCATNSRGYATPENRSPAELVFNAPEGFIPLWSENVTLRWRINEGSLAYFQNPEAAKDGIRQLVREAVLKWGDAAPVTFKETDDAWDFEVAMRQTDRCSISGCTLARAFFPDSGRHDLAIYPKMFTQSHKEQVDTFIHEIGHVFGLRHFFANVSEKDSPSEIFGKHNAFSIMNYGAYSELTDDDKSDLKLLYSEVWSDARKKINGTRIVKVRPYHELGVRG